VEAGLDKMPWYNGPTLLGFLETVQVGRTAVPHFRFPVQLVSHVRFGANKDSRGYLGRVEAGVVKPGDEIVILPSGAKAHVAEIITLEGTAESAQAPDSITLILDRQLDISRGDTFASVAYSPVVTDTIHANVCWLDVAPLSTSRRYWLKHGTRTVRAQVASVTSRYDINTLQRNLAETLNVNDIGELVIRTVQPLVIDAYSDNHATGSFILIDDATNATVAAGTIKATSHE
jgi:sulfate adenylyltransferase subunit 1